MDIDDKDAVRREFLNDSTAPMVNAEIAGQSRIPLTTV